MWKRIEIVGQHETIFITMHSTNTQQRFRFHFFSLSLLPFFFVAPLSAANIVHHICFYIILHLFISANANHKSIYLCRNDLTEKMVLFILNISIRHLYNIDHFFFHYFYVSGLTDR